jgi:hypothetical protein
MGIDHIRSEIEHMRTQVSRQRGEIRQLQRVGIPTTSAEALLERMLNKIDALCTEAKALLRTRSLKRFSNDFVTTSFLKHATRDGAYPQTS